MIIPFLSLLAPVAAAPLISAYFADWSKYHLPPYNYDASDLAPLAPRLQEISYSFMYFCPPPGTNPLPYWAQPPYGSCTDATAFQLMSVEPSDDAFLATIEGFRSGNKDLSVFLSIGGWNFPSEYFSVMASTSANRALFISSAISWLNKYSLQGIDIDWEYPCSPARADPVEISCTDFQTVADAGGKCPEDTTNIVLLFKELSAALTPLGKLVSLASQAGKPQEIEQAVALLHPYLSHFNVMSYDYAVSDLDGSAMNFSPNCPLFTPSANGTVQMSVNYTVHNYLSVGVPPEKLMIGFAYYGHTFFNPTLKGDDWKAFGGPTYVQGSCCGPFATTFGGKPGLGAQQCGTLMFSELQAALGSANASSTFFDVETQSDIAYFSAQGADGSTTAGTWVTYNGFESGRAFARYTKQMGLRGLFIFDTSMDTMDANGDFTYELSNAIADELAKA